VTDRAIVRRLRVAAFGILATIVSLEIIRAAVACYAVASHLANLGAFALAFSGIVIAIVAALYFAVFAPAYQALCDSIDAGSETQRKLTASEARYRSIFELHPNPAVALDGEGKYLRVNAAMERLSGWRDDELVGRQMRMTSSPDVQKVRHAFDAGLRGETVQYEIQLVRKDGEARSVHIDSIPMEANGVIEGVYAFVRDITDERRAQMRERKQRERFRAVAMLAAHDADSERIIAETLDFAVESLGMDAAHVGVIRDNLMSIVTGTKLGYPAGVEVPLERSFSRHVLDSNDVLVIQDVRTSPWDTDPARSWQPWGSYVGVAVSIGGDRSAALTLVKKDALESFDEADRDFVVVVASLIGAHLARERQDRELEELAFIDGLTRLPNRTYFAAQIDGAIAQARREDGAFAIHYVDLDGFKAVNDRHGHEAGDHVLAVVAARLKMAARLSDVVARHGGDEFVVLQRRYDGAIGASLLAQRLIDAAAEPIVIRDKIIRLGASVGIATFPADAHEADDLLRCADAAMYRAKHAGRNRLELFA
jgi:diguanylate cyclase (GGDEF)-like protein/PAS domain S-box-containing protein